MKERRSYFRFSTPARVALRVLDPGEEAAAWLRLRTRHVPPPLTSGAIEESRLAAVERASLELLQRVLYTLDRIERRLESLGYHGTQPPVAALPASEPIEIMLSASDFSGPFAVDADPGALLEAYVDLWDGGLPVLPAVCRLVRQLRDGERVLSAVTFEQLVPEDRERIIRLGLHRQSQGLRVDRSGGGA